MRHVMLIVTMLIALVSLTPVAPAADKPNVLFIAVDDLRPELGCYGASHIRSPHIDRLASRGTVFLRAYCQQAVCNPSRASLMTGLRPDTIRVWDLPTNFRKHLPDAVTVAQHFKQHGYHTESVGKIYHLGHGNTDDPASWSTMRKHDLKPRFGPEGEKLMGRLRAEAREHKKKTGKELRVRGLPWEAPDVADGDLRDGSITDAAIAIMREKKDESFFLAVGYLNPHLPFVAPKKYWDLYDPAKIDMADNPYMPKDAPDFAGTSWGELRQYHGIPAKGDLSDEQALKMRHGYYAAVSYVDAQVGRLLDELDALKLADNTIIVLWGDHGWKLGEHGLWCKHTNFELDARVPLIFAAPQQAKRGTKSKALVEFVDIYPTLCELAGLPLRDELEGVSVVPLLHDPDRVWKSAAFSQYPRGSMMGYSMKTDRYRFTLWAGKSDLDNVAALELYDHEKDPAENVNVAGDPAYKSTVEELKRQLRAGWQAARPPAK